jgi:hypothetical protein
MVRLADDIDQQQPDLMTALLDAAEEILSAPGSARLPFGTPADKVALENLLAKLETIQGPKASWVSALMALLYALLRRPPGGL